MNKTTFRISKMDCPSEEQLIRMKLIDLKNINLLEFDTGKRQLIVFHSGSNEQILRLLHELELGTTIVNSVEAASSATPSNNTYREKITLWQVFSINLFFFLLELTTGILSNSMALIADSLDMLADSIVYGLALFAVGGSVARKKNIAKSAGYFQLTLAVVGFIEVVRRFAMPYSIPDYNTMIIVSLLALAGNGLCLYLLQKSRSSETHMRASMIFTSNDIIVNLGVIVAGGLVYFTNSNYPDLVIGTIVFIIVGRGAFKILKIAE